MTNTHDLVEEFHETYHQPVRTLPSIDVPEAELRRNLINEEVQEFNDALDAGDIVEVFDALLDILWVVHGTMHAFGLPFEEGIEEVARSNRSKLDENGNPIFRQSDGKVLKGPSFSPPDLQRIIHATQTNSGGSR